MKVSNMQTIVETCLDTPWFEEKNTLLNREIFLFSFRRVVIMRKLKQYYAVTWHNIEKTENPTVNNLHSFVPQ